jgi:hypothetical protein
MNTLTLGFVGGCLTHQPGIPHPRLFHRLLARRLEDDHGVRLRFVVDKEFADEPRLRVARLLRGHQPDAIVLHRSTNTFFTKAMAVFVTDGGRYVLNPFLFSRRQCRSWLDYERNAFRDCLTVWQPRLAPIPKADDQASPRESILMAAAISPEELAHLHATTNARSFRLKDMAWAAAEWTGLLAWAIDDEERIVREVHAECQAIGASLILLGPGLRIGTPKANQHAARLDAAFSKWARANRKARGGGASAAADVTYVSVIATQTEGRSPSAIGAEHYCDVVHFNPAGHEHIANRLEPEITRLLAATSSR